MSQRAPRRVQKITAATNQPIIDGSAARALRPEPVLANALPKDESRQRVTLSLVPRIKQANKRSMVTMSVVLVALAFAVIVTLVLLNTSVAQRQYDIVSLRNQERALSQENQTLLKEAQSLSAPQALAAKAKDLGLVSPGAPGLISLSDGKVSHEAEEAVKAKDNKQEYGTLPLPGASVREDDSSKAGSKKSSIPKTTVGETSKQAEQNGQSADAPKPGEVEPVKSEREVTEDGRPVFKDAELNGGTIPAPSIKSPVE